MPERISMLGQIKTKFVKLSWLESAKENNLMNDLKKLLNLFKVPSILNFNQINSLYSPQQRDKGLGCWSAS